MCLWPLDLEASSYELHYHPLAQGVALLAADITEYICIPIKLTDEIFKVLNVKNLNYLKS